MTAVGPVSAQNLGDPAPAFSYSALGGGTISLSDHPNKVVFLFLFGNTCPFCLANGPLTESEIQASFGSNASFQALGLDLWTSSSTVTSVNSFRQRTGVTYPLGLRAGTMAQLYSTTYDRIIVVGPDGVIRYKGSTRVSQSEIASAKSVISQLLSAIGTGIEEPVPNQVALDPPWPNPAAGRATFTVRLPAASDVRLVVRDLLGREVAVPARGLLPAGRTDVEFNADGLPAGLYLASLEADGHRITRSLLVTR